MGCIEAKHAPKKLIRFQNPTYSIVGSSALLQTSSAMYESNNGSDPMSHSARSVDEKIQIQVEQNEEDQDDVFSQLRRATSKVIDRSSIIKKKPMSADTENEEIRTSQIKLNLPSTVDNFQLIQGTIMEEDGYSKITIFSSNIAMQFTIPKERAGPLIVPCINYGDYLSQLGQ